MFKTLAQQLAFVELPVIIGIAICFAIWQSLPLDAYLWILVMFVAFEFVVFPLAVIDTVVYFEERRKK